ncbi:hypothetical protein BU15DRAFT_68380 [Melanogaster broomeanus]|nr:hypothetical protein BU15DRAFT_68380 [Melanogaster broomeanus]
MSWPNGSTCFSFVTTTLIFVGTTLGVVYVVKQVSSGVKTTKESHESKGIRISDKGVSVKTQNGFDREDYVDATQRSFIKALNAASFGPADDEAHRHSAHHGSDGNDKNISVWRSHSGGSKQSVAW